MPTKIAIVQHKPVFNNLQESMAKAKAIISEAAKNKAKIIAFGECWLSGYPSWLDYCPEAGLWDHDPIKSIWAKMYENAVEIGGKEVKCLQTWAKKYKVVLVIGMNEVVKKGKGNSTIYNAIIVIGENGKLLNHHRKLMPTYTEKLVHGLGDGAGLNAVDTSVGRIGALICWEHWMPLARQAMHDEGEDIHFALWPALKESHVIASRQYAFEGRCFVFSIGQILRVEDLPKELKLPKHLKGKNKTYVLNGGSCVIGPNGQFLLQPQYEKEETIYFDLPPLNTLIKERMNLATSGHYQRPDIFKLKVNKKRIT